MEDIVMAITRNEPWTVVSQLQNEINRVFGNLNDGESSSATADWMPAVDVKEYADRFELLVDVPGVDPKQVEITLDNGVLTFSGERRDEQTGEKNGGGELKQQRRERTADLRRGAAGPAEALGSFGTHLGREYLQHSRLCRL